MKFHTYIKVPVTVKTIRRSGFMEITNIEVEGPKGTPIEVMQNVEQDEIDRLAELADKQYKAMTSSPNWV